MCFPFQETLLVSFSYKQVKTENLNENINIE